jgi:hypothetical protein
MSFVDKEVDQPPQRTTFESANTGVFSDIRKLEQTCEQIRGYAGRFL